MSTTTTDNHEAVLAALKEITTVQLAKAAVEVAKASPDTVYHRVPAGDGDDERGLGVCRYFFLGEPSCLFGHALARLEVPAFENSLNSSGIPRVLERLKDGREHALPDGSSPVWVLGSAIADAQCRQDQGVTWGVVAVELDKAVQAYEAAVAA